MSSLYGALFASFLVGAPINGFVGTSGEITSLADIDQRDLSRLVTHTRQLLVDHGIDAVVTSRVKSAESAYAKMRRKGLGWDELEDHIGLRIRVSTVDECYEVKGLIQQIHTPLLGSDDDYIADPKPNGYQSLHTVAHTGPFGIRAEFQIRTHEMHDFAENGPAAHRLYKMSA